MTILEFITNYPWQFFFMGPFIIALLIISIFAIASILGIFTGFIFRTFNRLLRTVRIVARGWPPEHLDADGDFKLCPDKIEDKDNKQR